MPRVKLGQPKVDPMTRLLKGYGYIDGAKLGRTLGVCPTTGRKKLNEPSNLTLADLRRINRDGVPIEEIRSAIT